jgi:hypothetical protein
VSSARKTLADPWWSPRVCRVGRYLAGSPSITVRATLPPTSAHHHDRHGEQQNDCPDANRFAGLGGDAQ